MIGMGAFLIYTLYLCEVSILKRGEINDQDDKPNTVFFDVQSDQVDQVKQIVRENGSELKFHDPMVTMRLTHIGSMPVSQLRRNPDYERWALSREYRSTFRAELREHEPIIEGEFVSASSLDSHDPIPISIEERLVEALSLKIGDTLSWDVQGLPLLTIVTGIRKVDWRQMQPNFFVVFPSGVLEGAPANHIIAVKANGVERIAALQGDVVKRYPNVSAINLSMVLETLKDVFEKVGFVVRFMASFTILTGLIALISTVLTSRYQRVKESVLLRSLGASIGQVRRIMAIEYFLLGGLGSATGITLSLAGAWAMTQFVFKIDLYIPWGMTIGSIIGVGAITLVTGMLNSLGIANRSPIEALRYD
jgi:putative ABC transport system permease protein